MESNKNSFGRRIVEIISFLIRELIEEDKAINDEDEIVEVLVNQGYKLEEINMAFVLIFSLEGKIEKNHRDKEPENLDAKRFLTYLEKFKLTLAAHGLLIRLTEARLITSHELERILAWVVKKTDEIGTDQLWEIIETIVDDPVRFTLMTNHQWTVDFFLDDFKGECLC